MDGLYELKEMLCKELEEYGAKGELTAGSLEIVDKLAHAIKNLDKIIEKDEEGYSERGGSYRGGYARAQGGNQGGGNRGGQDGRSPNRGGSYARQGRGMNARRDSMGRYSREGGYSRDEGREEMVMQLEDLMQDAPNQRIRSRIEQLIGEIENA